MENITRRNCLKLIGSLSGIIFLSNLSGCKEIPEEKEENGRIYHDENGTENLFWKPTGNSKDFNPGEHFIYTIVSIQYKNNGQINIPEGYEYVSSETITSRSGPGSTTYQIKYNFINVVPVTALGSAGAALGVVNSLFVSGEASQGDVAVFTAMCMCWSGFLSTHVSMMDVLKCRCLSGKSIVWHTFGGIFAGIVAHWLFELVSLI